MILNDTLYPWVYDATNACITNSNCGMAYTTSTLSLSYKSDYVTEFQVDWLSYNYSAHQPLQLYIDGVLTKTTNSSSYSTPRYYLPMEFHRRTRKTVEICLRNDCLALTSKVLFRIICPWALKPE